MGVPRDERLELADHLAVAAQSEIGLDPILERRQPLVLEASGLAHRERLVCHIGERVAAPERERRGQQLACGRGVAAGQRGARPGGQRLEALGVHVLMPDRQHVAVAACQQRSRADPLAQVRYVALEGLGGGCRRALTHNPSIRLSLVTT